MAINLDINPEWRKPATIVVSALAAALFIWWLLRPDPILVDLHTVKAGPMQVTIDEEAVTEIKDIYRVSAPISGRVMRSPLKVGDVVQRGKTIVAKLEPVIPSFLDRRTRSILHARSAAAEASVAFAEASVTRARADLEFRKKELNRAKELFAKKTTSERRLDEAVMAQKMSNATLSTAIAQLRVRQREFESARAQLIDPGDERELDAQADCCIEVFSPVSGSVTRIMTESETVVQSGAALLEVGDPANLEVVVDLLSIDAVKIKTGAKAVIESWGGDRVLNAKVRRIEPTGFKKVSALGIEEQRVNLRLTFTDPVSTRAKLGHQYRVHARVNIWSDDQVLAIPLSAVFRKGARWAVFIADDGVAMLRTIELGRQNARQAQVLKGLREDDLVVLHPSDRIEDGVRIARRPS